MVCIKIGDPQSIDLFSSGECVVNLEPRLCLQGEAIPHIRFKLLFYDALQWWIQNFLDGGMSTPKVGTKTYYLAKFPPKTV